MAIKIVLNSIKRSCLDYSADYRSRAKAALFITMKAFAIKVMHKIWITKTVLKVNAVTPNQIITWTFLSFLSSNMTISQKKIPTPTATTIWWMTNLLSLLLVLGSWRKTFVDVAYVVMPSSRSFTMEAISLCVAAMCNFLIGIEDS